jgi:chemotaxis protein MotB
MRLLIVLSLLFCGCVTKAQHDRALRDAQAERDTLRASADKRIADDGAEIKKLRDAITTCEGSSQDRDQRISELTTAKHNAMAQLDEATAINQQLRGELERLGKDVDKILKEKGTLAKALDDAKLRLDELRKAQQAAEARAALFQDLSRRFHKMIEGKLLTIAQRANRFVLILPGDLLFDAGRAEVKPGGQGPLLEIANTFRTIAGRKFQVSAHLDAGHTKTQRFPTAWDLTAQRAAEVVKLFVTHGVKPEILSAAGYADVEPLAPGDKAKNRRLEIVLMPAAEEIVDVPAR